MCQHRGYHSLRMDVFTLLAIEGARNGEMTPRVPNIAVEITRDYRLTLEWDKIFAIYI